MVKLSVLQIYYQNLESLFLGYNLDMAEGATLSTDSGINLLEDDQLKIKFTTSTADVPVVYFGEITNRNTPKSIVVEIDNEQMSKDDLITLVEGEKYIVAGSGFDCEKWNSKVVITLKMTSNYEFSSFCRAHSGSQLSGGEAYEIAIKGSRREMIDWNMLLVYIVGGTVVLTAVILMALCVCKKLMSPLDSIRNYSDRERRETIGDEPQNLDANLDAVVGAEDIW